MKRSLLPIFLMSVCALTISFTAFSQTKVDDAIRIGEKLGDKLFKKKKEKLEAYLREETIGDSKIAILRVPADKISSNAKLDITWAQKQLDKCLQQYKEGKVAEQGSLIGYTDVIRNVDPSWPVAYYLNEWNAYESYNRLVIEQQEKRRDSIYREQELASKRRSDSLTAISTRRSDSIRTLNIRRQDSINFAKQVAGYYFINKPFVLLKEKALATSQTMGKLYLGSYVYILDEVVKSDYIQISVTDGLTGYIRRGDITDSLDKLTATADEQFIFRKNRYYKYEENAVYAAQQEKIMAAAIAAEEKEEAAQARKASAGRKYYTGPRGGCYYMSNGKKVYVDHSYCR